MASLANLASGLFGNGGTQRTLTHRFETHVPAALCMRTVADVERYPEFLPLCSDVEVRTVGPNAVSAALNFKFGDFGARVRHIVTTDAGGNPPTVRSVAEPTAMTNEIVYNWTFTPRAPQSLCSPKDPGDDNTISQNVPPLGCETRLDLKVDFVSPLHAAIFDANVDSVRQMMSSAFERRINDEGRREMLKAIEERCDAP